MATLQALPSVLVLLLLAPHARTATASTLEDTCRRGATGEGAAHDYDFCVKTLGADPASATADELGLAAIAARTARAAAKATGDRLAQMQAAETSPQRRQCLDVCAKDYAAAVRRLGRAARDVAAGGDRVTEAATLLDDVRGMPAGCDKVFILWAGESSPLTDADRELDDVVLLAFKILWYASQTGSKRAFAAQ